MQSSCQFYNQESHLVPGLKSRQKIKSTSKHDRVLFEVKLNLPGYTV